MIVQIHGGWGEWLLDRSRGLKHDHSRSQANSTAHSRTYADKRLHLQVGDPSATPPANVFGRGRVPDDTQFGEMRGARLAPVDLVRMENGLAAWPSAFTIPRVRWYFPSHRWYGSVLVPMAMGSPGQLGEPARPVAAPRR